MKDKYNILMTTKWYRKFAKVETLPPRQNVEIASQGTGGREKE